MRVSKQIGWSQESKLIYQIVQQTEKINQLLSTNQSSYNVNVSKQIGWSNESSLYYEWLRSLSKLTAHSANCCTTSTSSTTSTTTTSNPIVGITMCPGYLCGEACPPFFQITIYVTQSCADNLIEGCAIWQDREGTIPWPNGQFNSSGNYVYTVSGGVISSVTSCY